MKFASATDSKARWLLAMAALAALLAAGGCSSSSKATEGKSVLRTRSGETGIQVTESEQDGSQVVRVTTTFRGEEQSIVLAVDQPVYEVEIPLSLQQQQPGVGRPGEGGGKGDIQDLLLAQYLEKAQSAMIDGSYNDALRQVNLVLTVRPDHVQAHEMKGSIYYAMGNYDLANQEWEQVLALDPSNEEVRGFMDFMKNRQGTPQPPLPGGLPAATAQPPAAPPPGGNPPAGGQPGKPGAN